MYLVRTSWTPLVGKASMGLSGIPGVRRHRADRPSIPTFKKSNQLNFAELRIRSNRYGLNIYMGGYEYHIPVHFLEKRKVSYVGKRDWIHSLLNFFFYRCCS